MSGWIEKLRRVSNSGSKQGRSVVVLLSTDVREREGRVCMPNTMEQAALRRKEEKRQFCNDVLFTKEMTEEDVKRKLLSHFAYLEDQSFYCASAVDGRTRLDFHGERRVWDGRFINRTIRGNSALYILTEMKADDLSGALQKLSNEQASHSAGEASLAYIGHSTSLQMPTSSQIPESTLHSNQKRAPVKRKNDQGAEQGFLMVQPVVSPPVKHKKGNYYLVHVPANGQALNQMLPQNQLAKVTAAPNNRSATQTVQLPSNSATQTSMQRTVSPGQLPLQMHLHLQQNQSPAGLAQGQHQFVAPQGNPSSATGGSSQQVLVHREGGDLSKMPPGGSSVLGQIDSGCESSKDDCTDYESCESEESSVHPSAEMTPDWAFTREKKKFTVSFSDELPHDAISYKADFEGLEVADLTRKNPYTLIGHNPISQIQREVKVRIMIQTANDGFTSFREDLKFTYKDKMSELLKEVLASEKNRNAALEGLCKGLQSASSGSDDLNVFRLPEAGTSTKSDSDELKSVKLLTMLIYKAAQINSLEFVDVIFSTSVGKVVFSHYKNNPTLPEDVARANGHTILGNYLENVSKSLSKERIEDKSDTVNWLELEQALDKKQDQLSTPGTDDVQPPNYSESDEKQRDYDGDDEASNVSSPFSEATDPGCEDEDPAASNQAKAETQRDQKEEEGKGIESLFTDDGDVAKYMEPPSQTEESMKIFRLAKTSWIDCEDLNKVQGHYAKEETASASEKIPSVLSNLKLSIQAGEPTVLTHSPRRGEPTEVTDHGSYKSILVSSPLTLESDHIMEDATHENSVSAPRLNFTFPKLMDLPNEYTEWNDIKLPIDILLLVCDDNEFLACFFYLEKPSKTYHRDIGHAYFGFMGNGNKNKLKITVMKCSQGCAGPGGNYTYVTSAVRVLRPKAVFLVGACSGLDCKKTKLGDVVVSSKVITNTHQISASRHMRNFMRHVADGWNPPLKDSIEQEVMVHCGGDVLCRSEAVSEDVALKHPELIAVEIEGEDVYSAIHDLQVEWIFVKGVKDHINGDQSSRDNWGVFGSVMAASVVANILHDPVIFKEWCHSGEEVENGPAMKDATQDYTVSPPRLSFALPNLTNLAKGYSEWKDVQFPIDILLMTLEDNEFLACYHYLHKPFKTYHRDIGHAYFGFMGNSDENKLKITVMKCSQGCVDPGGYFSFVESTVRLLRPKAVFLVGACSGVDCKKTKLGDVVVSSKVTTQTHQIPSSRHICKLIRHAADGWNPPLKDPNDREVKVHCCGEVICKPEAATEDVVLHKPGVIAIEIGDEDVYSAVHDLQVEWIFVKGVKNHINGDQSSRDNWGVFASVMAASVVANILHDPLIFKDWCHSGEGKRISSLSQTLRKDDMGVSSVRRIAKLPETPWSNPRTSHSAESSVKEGICWLSYLKSTILLWIIVLWQLFCGKYHRPVEGGEFSGVPQQESVPKQAETVSETPQQEHIPKQPANVMAPSQESEDDLDYKAESGYVLVINNFIFPKRSDVARVGSAEDVKNLRSLFDDFNFKTRIEENLTQSQMVETLSETAEKDLNRYDCFVCVILTHGSKDGVYGTDDAVIRIEAITSYFRRDACPSLEGKPKIFLIQACRGSQQDRVPIESDSFPVPCASSSLPADADFLICFSSAPGHESYRHPEHGTWFISTVVETFKKYAEREDLLKMMLRVNYSVANYFSKSGLKQIPCQVSMLRRKVYFNPKYKPSLATNEGFAD
ncbi:uncharacterized protein LOC111325054 isoform X1 [Stylophora pistillata]|uniref:uncharacterized protein LOC111325054 isoform X1 n=1 Tax=Stylophora pistillata TaxID=50429 RepID=UPI000C043235|nr:uncharacterized protein LOC111325054 isoform X1 [Stylophora pistillata]